MYQTHLTTLDRDYLDALYRRRLQMLTHLVVAAHAVTCPMYNL
ncbi:unnamed protein product [Amoebophrya sp. A120]|nr:unnamed protein product [Amoebophrya sp. A120]|eukprot:GSA120T00026239001.1